LVIKKIAEMLTLFIIREGNVVSFKAIHGKFMLKITVTMN